MNKLQGVLGVLVVALSVACIGNRLFIILDQTFPHYPTTLSPFFLSNLLHLLPSPPPHLYNLNVFMFTIVPQRSNRKCSCVMSGCYINLLHRARYCPRQPNKLGGTPSIDGKGKRKKNSPPSNCHNSIVRN